MPRPALGPPRTSSAKVTASVSRVGRGGVLEQPGHDVDNPPLSDTEFKEGVEMYLYCPSGPSWHVLGSSVLR